MPGVVTAVAQGNATITVTTAEGNFTATCAVTVEKRIIHVTGVTLNETTLSFDLRETDKLTATLVATIAPNDATDKSVTWTSDNDAVATVADGLVTAVGVGNTTITVTTTDGNLTATCAVEVILSNGIYQISVDGISYSDYTIHNANSLSLMVYTSTGKLVATGNADISLRSMPAGTYLVRTPNGNVLKVLR